MSMYSNWVATKSENGDLELEAEVPFYKLTRFPLRASSPTVRSIEFGPLWLDGHG